MSIARSLTSIEYETIVALVEQRPEQAGLWPLARLGLPLIRACLRCSIAGEAVLSFEGCLSDYRRGATRWKGSHAGCTKMQRKIWLHQGCWR